MDYAELKNEYLDVEHHGHKIKNELGGMEIPGGNLGYLQWAQIPEDCLPVVLVSSKQPKGLICLNRYQLKEQIAKRHEHLTYFFTVPISRLMPIDKSNLEYFTNKVEADRKMGRRKRELLPEDVRKAMIEDIAVNLNRGRSAGDIAATYGTTAANVKLVATNLVKKYKFNIPGIAVGKGKMFDVWAKQLAENNPQLLSAPLAPHKPQINIVEPKRIHRQVATVPVAVHSNGKGVK